MTTCPPGSRRAVRSGNRRPRWLAATASSVLVAVLAIQGCARGDDVSRTGGGDRFVTAGHARTSPSGRFEALVVDGPVQNGVTTRVIVVRRPGSGQEVFHDTVAYSTRHGVGVTWLSTADQLWILSADVGHAHVEERDGAWVKTDLTPQTLSDLPTEIEKLA